MTKQIDAQLHAVCRDLWGEVRKDLLFFGSCGFAVGWLMVLQYHLKQSGTAPKESWADALFSDFVSFNAFGLVFVGLLAMGSLVTCLSALNLSWPRLESVVAHLQGRLAQLASSIVSFTLGLSAFALLHAGFTFTASGIALAMLIIPFDALIVIGFVSAVLVARRNPPFDRWWFGVFFLAAAVAAVLWFALKGVR